MHTGLRPPLYTLLCKLMMLQDKQGKGACMDDVLQQTGGLRAMLQKSRQAWASKACGTGRRLQFQPDATLQTAPAPVLPCTA